MPHFLLLLNYRKLQRKKARISWMLAHPCPSLPSSKDKEIHEEGGMDLNENWFPPSFLGFSSPSSAHPWSCYQLWLSSPCLCPSLAPCSLQEQGLARTSYWEFHPLALPFCPLCPPPPPPLILPSQKRSAPIRLNSVPFPSWLLRPLDPCSPCLPC